MVDPNEPIRRPANLNARIWRYLSVARLESLLEHRGLHFCRADQFKDPYEGLFPDDFLQGPEAEHRIRLLLCWRASAYANCWHLSELESATMWRLYAGAGVVLKSTFSRLQHAFPGHQAAAQNGLERIEVGMVQYDSAFLNPRLNSLKAILHKQPHFWAEQEVRAFFVRGHPQAQGFFVDPRTPISTLIKPTQYVCDPGYFVSIEPEEIITGIVVDPLAPDSLVADVAALVSRHGYRILVEKSTLHRVEYLEQLLIRERMRATEPGDWEN